MPPHWRRGAVSPLPPAASPLHLGEGWLDGGFPIDDSAIACSPLPRCAGGGLGGFGLTTSAMRLPVTLLSRDAQPPPGVHSTFRPLASPVPGHPRAVGSKLLV